MREDMNTNEYFKNLIKKIDNANCGASNRGGEKLCYNFPNHVVLKSKLVNPLYKAEEFLTNQKIVAKLREIGIKTPALKFYTSDTVTNEQYEIQERAIGNQLSYTSTDEFEVYIKNFKLANLEEAKTKNIDDYYILLEQERHLYNFAMQKRLLSLSDQQLCSFMGQLSYCLKLGLCEDIHTGNIFLSKDGGLQFIDLSLGFLQRLNNLNFDEVVYTNPFKISDESTIDVLLNNVFDLDGSEDLRFHVYNTLIKERVLKFAPYVFHNLSPYADYDELTSYLKSFSNDELSNIIYTLNNEECSKDTKAQRIKQSLLEDYYLPDETNLNKLLDSKFLLSYIEHRDNPNIPLEKYQEYDLNRILQRIMIWSSTILSISQTQRFLIVSPKLTNF